MRRRKWTPAARARPPVALALNPVGMSARDVVIAALNASRACFHVFRELGTTLGWSLNKLEDVLNEEGGPERLDQAYSFLQSCQRLEDRLHMDGGERTQKLEDILRKPRPGETDDEEDQDDGDADDEGEDVFEEDAGGGSSMADVEKPASTPAAAQKVQAAEFSTMASHQIPCFVEAREEAAGFGLEPESGPRGSPVL